MATCPDCRADNPGGAVCCQTCGAQLLPVGLRRQPPLAIIACFATPVLLFLAGIAVAADLGAPNPWLAGLSWGISLAWVYVMGNLAYLGLIRWFDQPWTPLAGFGAGMYALIIVLLADPAATVIELRFVGRLALLRTVARESFIWWVWLGITMVPIVFGLVVAAQATRPRTLGTVVPIGLALGVLLGTAGLTLSGGWGFAHLIAATEAAKFGLTGPALTRIDRALASQPDLVDAWLLRARIYRVLAVIDASETTHLTQAHAANDKALALAPWRPDVLVSTAESLSDRREYDRALGLVDKALAQVPNDHRILGIKAHIALRAGRDNAAIDAYKAALAIDPRDPLTLNNLAYTLLQLDRDPVTALALARDSVRLLPGQHFNLDTLAWALAKNGMDQEAYDTISAVKAMRPGSPDILFHHAVIAHRLGIIADPSPTLRTLREHPTIRNDPGLLREIDQELATLARPPASGTPGRRQLANHDIASRTTTVTTATAPTTSWGSATASSATPASSSSPATTPPSLRGTATAEVQP